MKSFTYDLTKSRCPSCGKQEPGVIRDSFYCKVCKEFFNIKKFCIACEHVYQQQHAYDMHKSVELT